MNPTNLLIESVATDKMCLMEVFDEMFGHGGYSGIAFQQLQNTIKDKQGRGLNIENMSVKSNTTMPASDAIEAYPIESLLKIKKRSIISSANKHPSSAYHEEVRTNYTTTNRPESTVSIGRRDLKRTLNN